MGLSKKQLEDLRVRRMAINESEERTLKQLHNSNAAFDEGLFSLGEYCFNHPEKMDELDEKILKNKSFINGYERSKRLVLIAKLTSESTDFSQSKARK